MNSDIKSSDTIRYLCKGGCKKEKTIPDFGKKPNGDIYKQCIESWMLMIFRIMKG